MRRIAVSAIAILAAAGLTGCGTSTKIVNSNISSVSIVFDGDSSSLPRVNKLATAECQKNGRIAVLQGIESTEDGRVANYQCRVAGT